MDALVLDAIILDMAADDNDILSGCLNVIERACTQPNATRAKAESVGPAVGNANGCVSSHSSAFISFSSEEIPLFNCILNCWWTSGTDTRNLAGMGFG